MEKILLLFLSIILSTSILKAQTVVYDIYMDSTVGLTQTSGDICSSPWVVEEAHQTTIGNSWGGMWTSTNAGNAVSVVIQLGFTVSDTISSYPSTLNGSASNNVDPGPAFNCEQGTLLSWSIDPTGYNEMGLNTFLVDYAASDMISQLDNLPYAGDPYLRVTVNYSGAGIGELDSDTKELLKIVDLMGRETPVEKGKLLLHIYDDGSIEKIFISE